MQMCKRDLSNELGFFVAKARLKLCNFVRHRLGLQQD